MARSCNTLTRGGNAAISEIPGKGMRWPGQNVSRRGFAVSAAIAIAVHLVASRTARANILCDWFRRCAYESPGFQIKVVDKETREPLADVQDATSGPDGIVVFPAWGPIRGYRDGLVLNSDPVITLLKPGYGTAILNNAFPIGAHETDRVHRFQQDGQTFLLERFRGTPDEWVEPTAPGVGRSCGSAERGGGPEVSPVLPQPAPPCLGGTGQGAGAPSGQARVLLVCRTGDQKPGRSSAMSPRWLVCGLLAFGFANVSATASAYELITHAQISQQAFDKSALFQGALSPRRLKT
jgi:hypothetical protein